MIQTYTYGQISSIDLHGFAADKNVGFVFRLHTKFPAKKDSEWLTEDGGAKYPI